MTKSNIKALIISFLILFVVIASAAGGAIADRLFEIKPLDYITQKSGQNFRVGDLNQRVLNEESVVIDVAENVSPSVVTVSIETPERRVMEFSPFGGFRSRVEGGQPQDIGTGFVVSEDADKIVIGVDYNKEENKFRHIFTRARASIKNMYTFDVPNTKDV